jgi:small-conductance mechanosensitive channel
LLQETGGMRGRRGGRWCGGRLIVLALAFAWAVAAASAHAAETGAAGSSTAPAMDSAMSSAGWLESVFLKLEHEARSDISMLPDTPGALAREWRTFDRNGSALGALVNIGWIALAAGLALAAEKLAARCLSRRLRRAMRAHPDPTVSGLLLLLGCDVLGIAVFAGVFVYSRHWLMALGVTVPLMILASNVLIRWRIASLFFQVLLRPRDPVMRLVALPDGEAERLGRHASAVMLVIIALVGFGRYGLMDEDSGAPHVVALIIILAVCALNALLVFRARAVAEALIRGSGTGLVGALRAALARAWVAIGMAYVAGVFVFFVFGLSLGLLSYFHAAISSLGVLLLLLVFERLVERGWQDGSVPHPAGGVERLTATSLHRILRAVALAVAAQVLAWVWIDGIELSGAAATRALQSSAAAIGTLFVGYVAWELARLAIDRQLQNVGGGPKLPGGDDDEATPGSRLQTMLPMLRAGFAVVIAVVAALTVLSHLGIDTAPLIAGAGVFGLAISFGSQSLVRDIISGLFYIWDDAFRVGEYIDTGRLKGTVEALGVRSMKLRHHNGPLHTIPYGQLGAVTNQSRDFATLKFNLRLEPGTDLELVRKTAKRIGIEMQELPEIAAEVILPLKMQGIAEITDNAVVVRFKFTARPIKPSWIQREYLKRIYAEFAAKGIAFASGALTLLPPRAVTAEPEPALAMFGEARPAPAPATRVA